MDHILLWRGVSLVAVVRGGPGVRMAPRVPAESLRSVVFAPGLGQVELQGSARSSQHIIVFVKIFYKPVETERLDIPLVCLINLFLPKSFINQWKRNI